MINAEPSVGSAAAMPGKTVSDVYRHTAQAISAAPSTELISRVLRAAGVGNTPSESTLPMNSSQARVGMR